MGDVFIRWWQDPVASATIFIAVAAGIFSIYQLRALPRERRRRILDAMVEQYAETKPLRDIVLPDCPIFMHIAYTEIIAAIDLAEAEAQQDLLSAANRESEAGYELSLQHLHRLRKEAALWTRLDIGISYTDAHEVLASEFKIRALLWCAEIIGNPEIRRDRGLTDEVFESATKLVNSLNNFALDYENGSYPPRTMLGQLHRSIASTVKAVEPIIWAQSISGRWGRRVLRLGLCAQHFNDVVRIHRSSDLVWKSGGSSKSGIVIHPAKSMEIFGKEVLRNDLPFEPRVLPVIRLQMRTFYWAIIGKLALRPSFWLWSFGGMRLRRHKKAEDRLSACMRYALTDLRGMAPTISLSFNWDLDSLRADMERTARMRRKAVRNGRLAWLYMRKASGDSG